MIPVVPQPEPPGFDARVRQPGLTWLVKRRLVAGAVQPDATDLPPYWREELQTLWETYGGVCAYLAIYFDWPLGAHSVDHFVAKSSDPNVAYEWSNYRLSCLGANRRKNRFDDVLDPFLISDCTFELDLDTGAIRPGGALDTDTLRMAQDTIARLGLDDPETRRMRADHFGYFRCGDVSEAYLRRHSPFVWIEARRQGLLR